MRGQDDRRQELQGRAAFLGAVDLFRSLSPERLEQLAIATVTIRFAAGATIVSEGDDADYFYVVAEGEVELIRSMAPAGVRSTREHFGELASGAGVRHHAGAVTQTAASVYALDRNQVVAAVMSDAQPRRLPDFVCPGGPRYTKRIDICSGRS